MRKIKLMPDYFCFPLWDMDEPGNIDPQSLPISDALRGRLTAWAAEYDGTLNLDDPASSRQLDGAEQRAFDARGAALSHALARELGSGYTVFYFSEALNRLVPAEQFTSAGSVDGGR